MVVVGTWTTCYCCSRRPLLPAAPQQSRPPGQTAESSSSPAPSVVGLCEDRMTPHPPPWAMDPGLRGQRNGNPSAGLFAGQPANLGSTWVPCVFGPSPPPRFGHAAVTGTARSAGPRRSMRSMPESLRPGIKSSTARHSSQWACSLGAAGLRHVVQFQLSSAISLVSMSWIASKSERL